MCIRDSMTTVPPYAFDLWKKFDKVQISCSIDDLTDRNYYIRYPTKWIDVENNLNKLLQLKRNRDPPIKNSG